MKLSIIVPFNKGITYLRDCLSSIRSQALSDYEVLLCVDGGEEEPFPGEGTLSGLVEDFCDLPIRILAGVFEKHGVARARNYGIDEAAGSHILFLDADDYLDDGAIAALSDAALRHPATLIRARREITWYKRLSYMEGKKEGSGKNSENNKLTGKKNSVEKKEIPEPASRQGAESVTGILIPTSIIRSTGLRFNNDLIYYSDLPFVNRLISEAGIEDCSEAVYVKRLHNDSIRFPSLDQIEDKSKPEEFLKSYKLAFRSSAGATREFVEHLLCDYILSVFSKKNSEGLNWSKDRLIAFGTVLSEVREGVLLSYGKNEYRILDQLRKTHVNRARWAAEWKLIGEKKHGLLGDPLQWKWMTYKHIFSKLKVDKKLVVFESFSGKTYGDSPRYIYEYMAENRKGYKYVWLIDNPDAEIPGKCKRVKHESLMYFYYLAKAGYFISNMRQPAWFIKKPGNILLETWHGTTIKKLVFDMEDVHSATPEYKKIFYKQSRAWDYLLSDNEYSTEVFHSAFLYPKEKILELGYPREDILYRSDKQAISEKVKTKLNIPKGKKVVLYAPTWRDDNFYKQGEYAFDLPISFDMMRELGKDYCFILRLHYFIADRLTIPEEAKAYCVDASRYNDIGELYLASDILVTDYSSVFFDYAHLGRPVLFYTYDYDKYRDILRGFYLNYEEDVPGPLLYNEEELKNAILGIDAIAEAYKEKYADFRKKFCSFDDGHASERVVNFLFKE